MRTIGALVFPDFELLDVFGPLEMFGMLTDEFDIRMIAQSNGTVKSAQGPVSVVDMPISTAVHFDLLLIPGGAGTRREILNDELLHWLNTASTAAELTLSVCTGSALLARAGILDGKRATTNKRAFEWVRSQGPAVKWVEKARWVEDGNVFTSSGVSAGMDMSLAVISRLLSRNIAEQVAHMSEYVWNDDADDDPFA